MPNHRPLPNSYTLCMNRRHHCLHKLRLVTFAPGELIAEEGKPLPHVMYPLTGEVLRIRPRDAAIFHRCSSPVRRAILNTKCAKATPSETEPSEESSSLAISEKVPGIDSKECLVDMSTVSEGARAEDSGEDKQ